MATNSKLIGAFVIRKRITSNYRFRIVGSKPWLPSVYLYLSIFHFVVNEKHRFYLVFWHSDISKHLILNIFFSRSLFMFWQLESGILTCKLQADTSQIRWNMLNKSPLEKIQRFFIQLIFFFRLEEVVAGINTDYRFEMKIPSWHFESEAFEVFFHKGVSFSSSRQFPFSSSWFQPCRHILSLAV